MTFDEWWDRPEGCGHTTDTYKGWEASCHAAWNAGQEQLREELAAANLMIDRLQKDTEEVQAARIYLREQERMLKQLAAMREELAARDLMIERMREALENIRLFAARHRNEELAKTVLRFCSEGGATGSPLRSTEALRDRDRKRDAALLMKVANRLFNRGGTIEALAKARLSGEWEPDLNQGEVK